MPWGTILLRQCAGLRNRRATVSGFCGERWKMSPNHKLRRTAPIASVNVRLVLRYQTAAYGAGLLASRSQAHRETRLYRPSRVGVVRAIALSDHWRCVSTPRCARVSAKVTSICHLRTNRAMISAGSMLTSVLKKACGARLPSRSRTSTQRMGNTGVPGLYHRAVLEVISSSLPRV